MQSFIHFYGISQCNWNEVTMRTTNLDRIPYFFIPIQKNFMLVGICDHVRNVRFVAISELEKTKKRIPFFFSLASLRFVNVRTIKYSASLQNAKEKVMTVSSSSFEWRNTHKQRESDTLNTIFIDNNFLENSLMRTKQIHFYTRKFNINAQLKYHNVAKLSRTVTAVQSS